MMIFGERELQTRICLLYLDVRSVFQFNRSVNLFKDFPLDELKNNDVFCTSPIIENTRQLLIKLTPIFIRI